MSAMLQDLAGFAVATLLGVPLILLPGFVIGYAADVFGLRGDARASEHTFSATLVASAALPILYALAIRGVGLDVALGAALSLTLAGAVLWWRPGIGNSTGAAISSARSLAAVALWCLLVAYAWIDFPGPGGLYMSWSMNDGVKHAAVVQAIVSSGRVPPPDVLFLRDGASGYYYFYYVISALIERLGFGLVDARMAVAGQTVWTGIGLAGLVRLLWQRVAPAPVRSQPPTGLLGALACLSGFQILYVGFLFVLLGRLVAQSTEAAGDQITTFLQSLLWVPHHVATLLAVWTAFLVLADRMEPITGDNRRRVIGAGALAACAFASAPGLSVWMTVGAAVTAANWLAILLVERRWQAAGLIALAGLGALVLAAPDLADMIANRAGGETPLGFGLRRGGVANLVGGFVKLIAGDSGDAVVTSAWYLPVRFVLVIATYAVDFGIFGLGAFLFWRARRRSGLVFHGEIDRLLAVSAVVALVIGTFVRSTVLNNDLGWRVPLFTQLAFFVWSAVAFHPIWQRSIRRVATVGVPPALAEMPRAIVVAATLGASGLAYDLAAMRIFPTFGTDNEHHVAFTGVMTRDLRAAYTFANVHVPAGRVLQHNPHVPRAFAFGLHSHHRVALSDRYNATILGAATDAAERRAAELAPIFDDPLPAEEVRARARRNSIDVLVITANDKAWWRAAPWFVTAPSLYASETVRLIAVESLENRVSAAMP